MIGVLAATSLVHADDKALAIAEIQAALAQNQRSNTCSIITTGSLRVNNKVDEFRIEIFLDAGTKTVPPQLMIREFLGPENGQLSQVAATWVQDEILYAYSFRGNVYSATPFGAQTRSASQTPIDSLLQKLNATTRSQVVHLVKFLGDTYTRNANSWRPWQPTATFDEGLFVLETGNRTEQFYYGINDPDLDIVGDEWLSTLTYFKRETLMGELRTTKWSAAIYPGSLPNDAGTFSFRLPAGAKLIQPGR